MRAGATEFVGVARASLARFDENHGLFFKAINRVWKSFDAVCRDTRRSTVTKTGCATFKAVHIPLFSVPSTAPRSAVPRLVVQPRQWSCETSCLLRVIVPHRRRIVAMPLRQRERSPMLTVRAAVLSTLGLAFTSTAKLPSGLLAGDRQASLPPRATVHEKP